MGDSEIEGMEEAWNSETGRDVDGGQGVRVEEPRPAKNAAYKWRDQSIVAIE